MGKSPHRLKHGANHPDQYVVETERREGKGIQLTWGYRGKHRWMIKKVMVRNSLTKEMKEIVTPEVVKGFFVDFIIPKYSESGVQREKLQEMTSRKIGAKIYGQIKQVWEWNNGKEFLKEYQKKGRRMGTLFVYGENTSEECSGPLEGGGGGRGEEEVEEGEERRGEEEEVEDPIEEVEGRTTPLPMSDQQVKVGACILRKDLKTIATPIPSTSIFDPEKTGVTYGVIGKSFSGKTTFLVNEMNKLTPDQLRQYNAIIYFTESMNASPLKNINSSVRERLILTDRFCPKILLALKKINDATRNKFKFLVMFDDILQLRGELLTKCILTLRNSNISSVISIQYEKILSPAQRSSLHNVFLFNLRVPSWDFFLRGFILGNIKELIPRLRDEGSIPRIAQLLREVMDDYILYYDQRKDETSLWKKGY